MQIDLTGKKALVTGPAVDWGALSRCRWRAPAQMWL